MGAALCRPFEADRKRWQSQYSFIAFRGILDKITSFLNPKKKLLDLPPPLTLGYSDGWSMFY
jgi:hypothetical protein